MEEGAEPPEHILYQQTSVTEQQSDSHVVWSQEFVKDLEENLYDSEEMIRDTGRMLKLSGNILPVKVGTVAVNAVLDTGAASCFVSSGFWGKLQVIFPKIKSRRVNTNLIFMDANSNRIELQELVEFEIEVRDCFLPVQCYISSKLPVPLVLGWDWMKQNDVVIMPNCETATFHGQPVLSIMEEVDDPEPLKLQLSHSVEIPPTSMVQCQVYVPNEGMSRLTGTVLPDISESYICGEDRDNDEYELFMYPYEELLQQGVIMSVGVITVNKRGHAYVKIANPTEEYVTLHRDEHIAQAFPMECYEILDRDTIHRQIVLLIQEKNDHMDSSGTATQTEVTAPAHYFDSEVFQPNVLRLEERDVSALEPINWGELLQKDAMTPDQRKQLISMLNANRDVFATSVAQVGRVSCVKHEIKLKPDAKIVRQRPYRLSPEKQRALDSQIQDLLQAKVIVESDSPWQSPVVMIKKRNKAPDGSDLWRTCIDYRALNSMTQKDTGYFAMPTFDDLYDSISRQRPQWMSSLDMLSGYYQIEMEEKSQDYTTFNTGRGSYKFLRCPFGLSLAPFSYSRAMHAALSRLGQTFVWFYLDDVFVASNTFDQHVKHLQKVFNQFRQYGFTVHPHKCDFARHELKFLGHIWTREGIKPDATKVEVMQNFPAPKSVTEVRRWLGLSGYYRRFVKDYSKLAHPLTELTKKDTPFEWTAGAQEAMDKIKEALLQQAVLYYPRLDREFTLNTDASKHSISSILSQKDDEGVLRPVAFFSMKLAPAQQVWDINCKEAFALVMSVRLHRHLIGINKLYVVTDNLTTRYLQTLRRSTSPKLLRWALELQDMDLDIRHAPGKTIQAVDALSRMPSANKTLAEHPNKKELKRPRREDLVLNVPVRCPSISDIFLDAQAAEGKNDEVVQELMAEREHEEESAGTETGDSADECENPNEVTDPVRFAFAKLIDDDEETLREMHANNTRIMARKQKLSPDFKQMWEYLKDGTLPSKAQAQRAVLADHQNFVFDDDGLLYHLYSPSQRKSESSYRAQLCLPEEYRGYVVHKYHDEVLGAHCGTVRLLVALRSNYFWPKMQTDVADYVRTCKACTQSKRSSNMRKAPMELRKTYPIFYHVHMDVVSLPEDPATGHKKCLVMIDSFSGYVEMVAVKSERAEVLATAFFRTWICRHSVPSIITTDRHKSFKGKFFEELATLLGSKRVFTSSNRPQSNSKVERTNSSILNTLRVLASETRNWCELLPVVRFNLNAGINSSSQYSPYFLAHGVPKGVGSL